MYCWSTKIVEKIVRICAKRGRERCVYYWSTEIVEEIMRICAKKGEREGEEMCVLWEHQASRSSKEMCEYLQKGAKRGGGRCVNYGITEIVKGKMA